MILTGLQQALSAHGSSVTTENGWQGRGRGQMSSVKTITIHHTAGGNDAGDLKVVRDGRSDLPGPLAQILLRRNGIPHIIAAGQAAHAGTSRLEEYRNPYAIGIEAVHPGTGSWNDVQYQGLARTAALLVIYYNVPVSRVLGHKETCSPIGRKVDPNFNMADFRSTVQGYVNRFRGGANPAPSPTTPIKESVLMALSNEDKKELYQAVWFGTDGAPLVPNPATGGGEWPFTALTSIPSRVLRESGLLEALERQTQVLDKLAGVLESVSNRLVKIEQIVSDPN